MTKDLINTPILKLFLSYFMPSFISMFVLSTYVIVDGIFVGNGIGEIGLGAIGLVTPIFSLFIGIELLFGIGGAALVSMSLGKNKPHKARIIFSSIIYCLAFLGILLSIIMFLFRKKLAYALGSNDELLDYVMPYLNVIIIGSTIILLQSTLCTFARNDKAPNLAMISFISGSIINIILNYIFIFIFKWGMFGAAFSTILGHFFGLLIILWHFIYKKGDLYFIKIFSFRALNLAIKSGISPSMTEFAFGFTIVLMNIFLINLEGEKGVAILSIIMYIGAVCFGSILSISHGLQPIASYNFGAGKIDRTLKTLKIGMIFAIIMGVMIYIILFFGIPYIAKIFLKSDTTILDDLIFAVKIYFLGYLFLGSNVIIAAFLQATGRNISSMIVSAAHNLVFMMILLPIFAYFFRVNGIWASYPVSLFCAFIIGIYILKKELKYFKSKE